MDEPFGALDPVTRRILQDELVAIHRRTGKTIVLVTHDMEEALKLADRIVVLDDGHVVQDGPPSAIVTAPATQLVRRFVGGEQAILLLLARRTVAEAMRAGELSSSRLSIDPTDNLSVALSRMLAHGEHELSVTGSDGRPIGTLGLTDLCVVLKQ